jgi:hypothetical protein
MTPAGYVVMQHVVRLKRPVQAYTRWIDRIPTVYREAVLAESGAGVVPAAARDPHRLAALKHYHSLMPLSQEARKPMFSLTAADGALGAHAQAATECYRDFRNLARAIAAATGLALPGATG